jgi:hypothetical protein
MKAWQVFVNFLIASKPDMFVGVKHTDKQKVTKKYREENEEEYQAFVENYIATPAKYFEYEPKGKPVSTSNAAPQPEDKPKKVKKVKVEAEVKVTAPPVVEEKPVVEAKAKKPKKEADVDKAEKPKKVTKKAAKADPVETPANTMWVKFDEEGVTYFRNSNNNSVFTILDDESPGEFIGKYNSTTKSIEYVEA